VARDEPDAAALARRFLFSREPRCLFRWRVGQRQVVSSAIVPSEVLTPTSFDNARAWRNSWLSLLPKSLVTLPEPVTSAVTKGARCVGVHFSDDLHPAVSAVNVVHPTSITRFGDGNHYSVAHGGRK
jgi:hypothetical protein